VCGIRSSYVRTAVAGTAVVNNRFRTANDYGPWGVVLAGRLADVIEDQTRCRGPDYRTTL
jgi:hypothetical protein